MMDLRNHLENIARPVAPPSAEQVGADLARGRRALRKRRTGQALTGSAFGVAALVAAFTVATGGLGAGPSHPDPGTARPAVVAVAKLVAYGGAQPKGFTIDKVPDGWFVQGDEDFNLVLAPNRAKNPGPNVDPSKQPLFDPRDYSGKIGVFLESAETEKWSAPRKGIAVKVGDRDGLLVKSLPDPGSDPGADPGWSVRVRQSDKAWLIVQFWEGLGMSQDQMVELTTGVHVGEAALASVD